MFQRPLVSLSVLLLGAGLVAARPAAGAEPSEVPGSAPVSFASASVAPTYAASAFGGATLGATTLEVRRYYRREPRRARPIQGWITLRGGIFEGEDIPRDQWTVGAKATGQVAENLRLGLSLDLHHRQQTDGRIVSSYVDAAGNRITQEFTTGRSEVNLAPLLAIAEVQFPGAQARPYVGAGVGWEFLNVRIRDYGAGVDYEDNYDGPGYQVYGGVDLPMAERARFNVEAYYNGGRVEQQFLDLGSGLTYDERIRTHGWGLRGGIGFAF